MAVTKTIIKNTLKETVVKVGGTAGSATIDLSVDLLDATKEELSGTQVVNITNVVSTGLLGSAITVVRNSVPVLAFAGENAASIQLNGVGISDTQENESDIVVTISGAEGYLYLTLRKESGYASKIETGKFSIYDDTTAVGS